MEQWEMIEPYPGAHIRVQVDNLYHHGIFVGDNKVVQFGLPMSIYQDPATIKVLLSPVEDFLNGGFLEVRIYDKKEKKLKNKDSEIVKIALSKVGEGDYSLLYNNCEHLANFCVFGKKISSQVDKVHDDIRKMLGL